MTTPRHERPNDLVERAVEATLELPTPDGPSHRVMSQTLAALQQASSSPHVTFSQRVKHMFWHMSWQYKTSALLAVAASLLVVYLGISNNRALAFDDVVKALAEVRTATYDFVSEQKNPVDDTTSTFKAKGYFLAPSRERVDFSGDKEIRSIMILDSLAAKGITLLPEQKQAVSIDIQLAEKSTGGMASMFDTVRRAVQEGVAASPRKIENVGNEEIDGRPAVGFRTHSNMGDMTLWTDPETARLVRVDFEYAGGGGRGQMTNFHYDMELDPALFSLEPPAGYTVQTRTVAQPAEGDFINLLRMVAEHNEGVFPDSIGTTEKTFMLASHAAAKLESEKLLKSPEVQERMKKLMAQYGEDKAGGMKDWMKEWMEMAQPIIQQQQEKYLWGVMFYSTLQPENDSHYAGKGIKMDTPDRPIFWYKPTGADKYRVLYADLSVKEVPRDQVPTIPATE